MSDESLIEAKIKTEHQKNVLNNKMTVFYN
jgi:hypothetical protein